ncbi:hypothetical protein [Streptomyces sp. NBC_00989]|uniref:hypothetical protein n=1 Tax=Streptomyces sp. NBC_00989 TaxID=2903705 RepID=UPI00386AA5B9|nr:hypothetical protein OG714_54760 [Streptomyces sp. NBC_00989]
MTDKTTYMSLVKQMAGDGAPIAALALATADARRRQNLERLSGDIRFTGINELLARLSTVGKTFAETPELSKLTFVVKRTHADFMTALEAALSGYFSVASDAMRDVLEIQYLLMDFAINPGHADDWLTIDDKDRWKRFAPAPVRKRLQTAGVVHFGDKAESKDYKGHSMGLHISPVPLINSADGIVPEHSWLNEAGFWEMFDHGRGLLRGLTMLIEKAAPGSRAEDEIKKDMPSFDEASRQAELLKQVWLAIPEARVKLREGDPATAGNIIIGAMVGSGILDRELIVSVGGDDAVLEALIETMHQLAESDEPVSRNAARAFLSIVKSSDTNTTASSGQGERPRQ